MPGTHRPAPDAPPFDLADESRAIQLSGRAGDILVLAGETPVRALATEAYLAAGRALLQLWQSGFALEQIDAALAIDPDCLPALQQRVVCLCRRLQGLQTRADSVAWIVIVLIPC